MRTVILVLGWVGVAGSVIGGLLYSSVVGFVFGLIYLVVGCIVTVPFFGLAATMKKVEEQAEEIESLRADIGSLLRARREDKAQPKATAHEPDGRAPLISGPRKLAQEAEAKPVEVPKLNLSGIKESDNR